MQPCTGIGTPDAPPPYPAHVHRIAYVFPGQGSQSVGMGQSLAAASRAAAAVFEAADAALGEPISALAWDGPAETLDLTENAQPALVADVDRHPRGDRARASPPWVEPPRPAFAAGHSMGQYTAMVAAGALDLADAVRLVRERGRLMQASARVATARWPPSSASTTRGCRNSSTPRARTACSSSPTGMRPGQVVVSGERERSKPAPSSPSRSVPSAPSSCRSRSPRTRR